MPCDLTTCPVQLAAYTLRPCRRRSSPSLVQTESPVMRTLQDDEAHGGTGFEPPGLIGNAGDDVREEIGSARADQKADAMDMEDIDARLEPRVEDFPSLHHGASASAGSFGGKRSSGVGTFTEDSTADEDSPVGAPP